MGVSRTRVSGIFRKSVVSLLVVTIVAVAVPPPPTTAKPTFSFGLPGGFSLAQFVGARSDGGGAPPGRRTLPLKPYTGFRMSNSSLLMVYWYDQTVAVAELGPEKLLLGCELIEVNYNEDRKQVLKQLSRLNRPLQINLAEMMKLMLQCQQVDTINLEGSQLGGRLKGTKNRSWRAARSDSNGLMDNSPLTLLSGIIPGTKWCGTGDIADNYHDLGIERPVDRCCRTHDLCPVKVRAFSSRFNLTNNSIYTKSHCDCDDELFSCLKSTNTPVSQIMGHIYFNVVRVPCVEGATPSERRFRAAKTGF